MDTFVEDFLNWGVSQLQGLPSTMFDAVLERKQYSHIDEGSHHAEERGTRQQLSQKQQHGSASSIVVGLRTVSTDEEGDKDDEHAESGYASSGVGDEQRGVRCKSGRRRKGKGGSPPRRGGEGLDDNGVGRRHDPTDEEVLAHLETWSEKNKSGSSSSSEEGRTKRRKSRNT